MAKIIVVIGSCLAMVALASPAHAADQAAFSSIQQLDMWPSNAVMYFADNSIAIHSCGGTLTKFNLIRTNPDFEPLYALAMSNYLSHLPVRLRYNCDGTEAIIEAIRSKP